MSLDSKTKELLNDFADTQVALNDRDKPRGQSEVKLGDLLDEAHGAIRSKSTLYKPARDGGTDGETYTLAGLKIPAGAIVTRAWIATNTVADQAASLTFKLGAITLTAVADATAAVLTKDDDIDTALPADTTLTVDVGGAAPDMTEGEFLVVAEWIYPVK